MAQGERDAEVEREVEALLALVRERYGARLTDEQAAEVRKAVETIVKTVGALRAVGLRNADEPAQPFLPYRGEP